MRFQGSVHVRLRSRGEFARETGKAKFPAIPLVANMVEEGKTPALTSAQLVEGMSEQGLIS